ncbi:DUF5825 family protein [Streptomyces sp. NPDC060194]|uniref:DUF5825 family protein n=1 Tax=Streptomyces sp. NPDC060194 TaxID=3347069 RepID=UPI0036494014
MTLDTGIPHRITGRRVHVEQPLRLDGTGPATALEVRFLRDCQTQGLRPSWRTAPVTPRDAGTPPDPGTPPGPALLDLGLLHHLQPPEERPDEAAEVARWRASHAQFPHGMLYHRRGPGFVTVMDRRTRPASARFTLDHPDLLAAFDIVQTPTPLDALTEVHQEAVALLAAERLALVVDGWTVALPPRMRRWPVPCTRI